MRETILEAIKKAGVSPPQNSWTVTGTEPFFRSPLPLATGASAVLVALGDALAQLHQVRGGKSQAVGVDAEHAALSLLSMWLLKVDNKPALTALSDGTPPPIGEFRCSDNRTIHLQPGLPHHTASIARVLDCIPTPAEIEQALSKADSLHVESRLAAAGIPACIVRSETEWLAHPQGRTMGSIPVVEIERIGACPPERLPVGDAPLTGIRVLDLTRVLAGPTCARTLGESGADVLHIDAPQLLDLKAAQADTAHGKRMALLDLDSGNDQSQLRELATSADVFVQSYRAGRLARRGFGPRALAQIRPGIVYVSVNCYGHHGPWREHAGYDGNAMAATGIRHLHSVGPNPGIAVAMNDYATAYWGAYGVATALRHRATQGGSWHVRVSLAQSAMWFLSLPRLSNGDEGCAPEGVEARAERYRVREDSPYGVLEQLPTALMLERTPLRWQRGTHLPGTSSAEWL